MKIPKKQKTYCPKCKKHTEMTVAEAKRRTRSTAHPMSRGANSRMRKRGLRRGFGNQNKYSKPPGGGKRVGAKSSKKIDLRLKCAVCKKMVVHTNPRAKKVEFV
ncbi:50S ribosomal protein L44e [archaeon]|mgnify:CR=1 FL=1|jgi:large subunit ribosomal protein L44e|nr:50S ribosomal protein L44e [archaeon]MBT3730876.1 50S ribosomal protein L44e [archaeon]MBT4669885.1 50S ribosomal protein L44e [archaeon]MBT5030037.1 50S ribosomal protein L44e [archaeon]MBT5288138.1 50S ribosomal protein L44e [archaeon]